jgi:sialic acid synthase SpsE
MATDVEMGDVLNALIRSLAGGVEIAHRLAILHCVSAYPAPFESMNLARLMLMTRLDDVIAVGLSDHSRDLIIPPMAVALGASIIEKHIMDYEPNGSLDNGFALNPTEFADTVQAIHDAEAALSAPTYDAEADSRQFRRRLVYTEDVNAGG